MNALANLQYATSPMRGLSVFISDLRACRSREEEEKRINKELANIRNKFKEGSLSGYDKKKYVCKLIYIHLLGWDIDFGHMEAVNLISSSKYTEKQIGYLAVSLLINENDDLVRLIINSMRKDLEDINEINICLALQAIADLGGKEIAESLAADVFKVFASGSSVNFVKKKAALCLLRLYRKHPEVIQVQEWAGKIIEVLEDYDLGVNLAGCSLLQAVIPVHPDLFAGCVPKAVYKLHKIVIEREYVPDNVYYNVPVPWLQVKLLRLMQSYPVHVGSKDKLLICLSHIFADSKEQFKTAQQNNAVNAVLFEAIQMAVVIDPDSELVMQSADILSRYLQSRDINMRCLGLDALANLARYPRCLEVIKQQQRVVLDQLKERDITVRQRALDLLYNMCDYSNAKEIVGELLAHLPSADYAIKEDLVLKIAIMAEKFAADFTWYVDVVLQLISQAGDHVSSEVSTRVVQIVTNNQQLHAYAARQVLQLLRVQTCHENAVKIGGYLLGEFGDLVVDQFSPIQQFAALHSKFGLCTLPTRALLLSSYAKLANLFPEIKADVMNVLGQNRAVLDVELQQRACEYSTLVAMPDDSLLQAVFEQMPPFPERDTQFWVRMKKDQGDKASAAAAAAPTAPTVGGAISSSNIHAVNPGNNTSSTTAPVKQSGIVDLLGLDDGLISASAPAVAVSTTVPPSAASQAQIDGWLNNLLDRPSGVLYEDSQLQIGLKAEFSGNKGRLSLFLGNKSSTPYSLDLALRPVAGLQIDLIPPVVTSLAVGAQLPQVIQVESNGLPTDYPPIQLTLAGNGRQQIQLCLPVPISRFFEPVSMQPTDFMNRWRQIGGPPKESQEMVKLSAPVQLATVRQFLTASNVGLIEGCDPNPNNFVSACVYHASQGKAGFLLRLECSPDLTAFRLTVRSTSEALCGVVKNYLANRIRSF